MVFRPPSKKDIHEFIINLPNTSRSERKDTIAKLQTLLNINDHDELMGGVTYEAEKIDIEYRQSYVPIPAYFYSATRSDLYNELNECLHNSPVNSLDPKQKLLYIHRYYQLRKQAVADSKEPTSALDDEFKPVIDNLLEQMPDFKKILATRPSLDDINKKLKKGLDAYQQQCKTRSSWNPPTADYVKFTKILQLMSSEMMDTLIGTLRDCKTKQEQNQFRYSAYYGALLFIMKRIEYDCSGATLRNKENSAVYQFCKDILNISHTDDIPDVIKMNFFVDFGRFIKCAREYKQAVKILEACTISKGWLGGPTYFTDAEYFLDDTARHLHTILTDESYLLKCVKCLGSYAYHTIIWSVCLEVGAGIYAAGVGVNALPFIFERISSYFMGGSLGEKFAKKYAIDILKQAEPAVMTTIYTNTVWFFGKKTAEHFFPPIDPILAACDTSRKFRAQLIEEVSGGIRKPDPLLVAIAELPSTMVKPAVRERIQDLVTNSAKPTASDDTEYKHVVARP